LYEALYNSKKADPPIGLTKHYEIKILQDHKDNRFRRLHLGIIDRHHLVINFENREYYFQTTPEFVQLFEHVVNGLKE
jgi:hypothetical protein